MAINNISRDIRDIHSLLVSRVKPAMRTVDDSPRVQMHKPTPVSEAKAKEPEFEFVIGEF